MRSVELFAGAGGLAIGMENAGFKHAAVIEWDHCACDTFRKNQKLRSHFLEDCPIHEIDARQFDFSTLKSEISVVSGGPPCQPFSMGGKHQAQHDHRNMFPEAIRAVRELMPKAFIFENVKGLTRDSFSCYFSYIHLQLQHPEIIIRRKENWSQHLTRLQRHHSANKNAATYNVVFDILNAADFGIPQKRERIFFVGFRSDIGAHWSFPEKTHSEDSLLISKWIDGSYWDEHRIGKKQREIESFKYANRINKVCAELERAELNRWRTTRDALKSLRDPETHVSNEFLNHVFIPGAKVYKGHTGSILDEPAKTLKAGQHGVPGGENMLVKDDGTVRYFTVREAARLQTFPDSFAFHGSWGQNMRQLGNAVPVKLAEILASSILTSLKACKS